MRASVEEAVDTEARRGGYVGGWVDFVRDETGELVRVRVAGRTKDRGRLRVRGFPDAVIGVEAIIAVVAECGVQLRDWEIVDLANAWPDPMPVVRRDGLIVAASRWELIQWSARFPFAPEVLARSPNPRPPVTRWTRLPAKSGTR
jgi:hypothetical protein